MINTDNLNELIFNNSKINIITTEEIQVWNESDNYIIALEILDINNLIIEVTEETIPTLIQKYNLKYYNTRKNKWKEKCITIPKNSHCTLEIDISTLVPSNPNEIDELILVYNDMKVWTNYINIIKVIKPDDEYI